MGGEGGEGEGVGRRQAGRLREGGLYQNSETPFPPNGSKQHA